MAESEYNGKPGKWRTVKGRKVFFPDGEDEKAVLSEAFGSDYKPSKKRIKNGKFEKSDDGENWEELEDSQSYNDYYADEDEFDSNEDGDFEEGKLKIQVKYDGKQIEMEIPSNIEEDWQVDEAVKEKLEQIEGHEVEDFEWDIANENDEEFNKAMDDAGYEINKEEYGIKKKEKMSGEPSIDYDEIERRKANEEPKDEMGVYLDKQIDPKVADKIRKVGSKIVNDKDKQEETKMHLTRSIKNALEKEPNLSLNGYMKEHSKDGNIPNFLKLIGLENSDFKGTDALSDIYNALNPSNNKEPANDMDPYERPAEGIANSEEDDKVIDLDNRSMDITKNAENIASRVKQNDYQRQQKINKVSKLVDAGILDKDDWTKFMNGSLSDEELIKKILG